MMSDRNSDSQRLKRIETRMANFMRWFGYSPSREVAVELEDRVVYDEGALHASSPRVTVGDVLQAAHRHKLDGDVPLYVNGIRVAVVNVSRLMK